MNARNCIFIGLMVASMFLLTSGCQRFLYESKKKDAAAKHFEAVEEKASFYFFRRPSTDTNLLRLLQGVRHNESRVLFAPLCEIPAGSFANVQVRQGLTVFAAFFLEDSKWETKPELTTGDLGAGKGAIYFFELTSKPQLIRVPETEAKAAIRSCRLVCNFTLNEIRDMYEVNVPFVFPKNK